jgi:hypothetical protein
MFRGDDRYISRRAIGRRHFPGQMTRPHFHQSSDLQYENTLSRIQPKFSLDLPAPILFPPSVVFSRDQNALICAFLSMLKDDRASLSGSSSLTPRTCCAISDVSLTETEIGKHPNHFRFIVSLKGFSQPLPAVLS